MAFLHWFPKRSRLRFYYATACRAVGFGYHKDKLGSIGAWARNRCQYIDEQTFYRTLPEIHRKFGRYFRNVRHWEASYLRERLGARAFCARFRTRYSLRRCGQGRVACSGARKLVSPG